MRTILLSAANHLIPVLALLFPVVSVLSHADAFIQPTPAEMIAFMVGAVAAAVVSATFCTPSSNTTPFQEVRHD